MEQLLKPNSDIMLVTNPRNHDAQNNIFLVFIRCKDGYQNAIIACHVDIGYHSTLNSHAEPNLHPYVYTNWKDIAFNQDQRATKRFHNALCNTLT